MWNHFGDKVWSLLSGRSCDFPPAVAASFACVAISDWRRAGFCPPAPPTPLPYSSPDRLHVLVITCHTLWYDFIKAPCELLGCGIGFKHLLEVTEGLAWKIFKLINICFFFSFFKFSHISVDVRKWFYFLQTPLNWLCQVFVPKWSSDATHWIPYIFLVLLNIKYNYFTAFVSCWWCHQSITASNACISAEWFQWWLAANKITFCSLMTLCETSHYKWAIMCWFNHCSYQVISVLEVYFCLRCNIRLWRHAGCYFPPPPLPCPHSPLQ